MDPIVIEELIYANEYELAYTPSDFFIRRTSALFFDIDWVREHKQTVISYMSDAFQWTDEQCKNYELALNEKLHEAANPEEKRHCKLLTKMFIKSLYEQKYRRSSSVVIY